MNVTRLLESPNMIIRGKAFLVVMETIKNNQEMLLLCIQHRLVMYMERDCRRQIPAKSEHGHQMEYLTKCLEWLIESLVDIVPRVTSKYANRKGNNTVTIFCFILKHMTFTYMEHTFLRYNCK